VFQIMHFSRRRNQNQTGHNNRNKVQRYIYWPPSGRSGHSFTPMFPLPQRTSSQKDAGACVRGQQPEWNFSGILLHVHFPRPTPKYAKGTENKTKSILRVWASNEKTHYTSSFERLWKAAAGRRKQLDIRLASQQNLEVQPRIMAFGGLYRWHYDDQPTNCP
jgi:hypothetical protein